MRSPFDYTGRTVLTAKGTTRQLWANLAWENQTDNPDELPDGRDLWQVINEGSFSSLDLPMWLKTDKWGTLDDFVWSSRHLIVSDKVVDVLRSVQHEGYEIYPLEVRSARKPPVHGYNFVLVTSLHDNSHIRPFPARLCTNSVEVSPELFKAIKDASLTGYETQPAAIYWKSLFNR